MELRAKYKQTEVGVIPADWQVIGLGPCCQKIQDGNYGGEYPKSHEFLDHGIPFLTSKAIGKDGSLKESLIDHISPHKHAQLNKAHIELNDVLFTNRGASVGAIGYVDNRTAGGNIGPQLTLLRVSPDVVTPRYLFHSMKSFAVQKQIRSQDSGSAMNFFGITATKKFKLTLPPTKAEQEAIAEALSDADGLIESLEQLIAKRRNLKQGAMQELLTGKTRLPGFETSSGYKQTEVGVIPNDWGQQSIGNITVKVGSGVTPKGGSGRYKEHGRPFVRSQNVGWGQLLLSDLAYIDEETHSEFSATELNANDVLLNITGASIGRCAIADQRLIGGNVNQHVCIVRSNPKVAEPPFIQFFLLSSTGQDQIANFQAGGNREGLNFQQIRSIKLPLPPTKAEQEAIVTILSDMDTEITALDAKLTKVRQLKQGMMHNLLTGRIRLI